MKTRKIISKLCISITLISLCLFLSSLLLIFVNTGVSQSLVKEYVFNDNSRNKSANVLYNQNEHSGFNVEYNQILQNLNSKNTSVVNELEKRISDYELLLKDESNNDIRVQIQMLIKNTKDSIDDYIMFQSAQTEIDECEMTNSIQTYGYIPTTPYPFPTVKIDPNLPSKAYVSAAIAAFNTLDFTLSAELLTAAKTERDAYTPIYWTRVLSSQVIYDIMNSDVFEGTDTFQYPGSWFNTYIADTYFAIRQFKYKKFNLTSKGFYIFDEYDYHDDSGRLDADDSVIQGFAYEKMYQAQLDGVIHPFSLVIPIDPSEFLRLQIHNKINDTWQIKVTNNSNKPIDVVYNMRMCFSSDVYHWENLTDINTFRLEANSYKIVDVREYGTATSFAFCFIKNSIRYITYANETWADKESNLNIDVNRKNCQYYNDIGIIGKNNSTWIIHITNTHGERKQLRYNSKMCYEKDAKDWSGLKDIVNDGYMEPNETRVIYISENYAATDIAIELLGEAEKIIIYADKLSKDCTMNVSRIISQVYNYLQLRNLGKSGKYWQIEIHNPTSNVAHVYYNEKMCYENDAKNWSGLKDENDLYIDPNQSRTVSISTNWSATSIAVCYFANGKRLISYANKLSKSGGINVMYNYL